MRSWRMITARFHVYRSGLLVVISLTMLGAAGCRSLGPRTIPRDRLDYSAALADSWKSMMLLNIVKTRYLDLPVFLDVGQVVSAYTLQTSGSVGGGVNQAGSGAAVGNITLNGAALYSQQPTITYTPLTGDKFLVGFLSPVEPAKVVSLLQSGYDADFILQLGAESLNGLRNQPVSLGSKYHADPQFFRVLTLLREIQDARAIGFRVEHPTNGQPATVFIFRSERLEPEIEAKITEARELLGLPAGQSSFRLVASPVRGGGGELTLDTRSLWQMLVAISMGVEVPPRHREARLAPPMPADSGSPLLRVHSGPSKPTGAYIAVPYEGQWFWIASDDWRSKRTLTSILFLFSIADTGGSQNVPTLTIPTR